MGPAVCRCCGGIGAVRLVVWDLTEPGMAGAPIARVIRTDDDGRGMRQSRVVALSVVMLIVLAGIIGVAFVPKGVAQGTGEVPDDASIQDLGPAALLFISEPDLADVGADNKFFDAFVTELENPALYNPFKGQVTYDSPFADEANISAVFGFVLNPGVRPLDLAYEPDAMLGWANGQLGDLPGTMSLPPAYPPGTSFSFDEFTDSLTSGMGIGPDGMTVLESGAEINVVRPEPLGGATLTGQPVFVLGARTVVERTFGCPGTLRDTGLLFDTPLVDWNDDTGANSSVFNDFFFEGDSVVVTNCQGGDHPFPPSSLVFGGPGSSPAFAPGPSTAVFISGPHGWLLVVNGGDAPDASSVRWFDFVTDTMAPYNPDYTAASAYPADLTTLQPLSELPHVVYDESLLPPPDTTSSTTTSTLAASAPAPPSVAETTSSVVASPADPVSGSGGFPFPILIFGGLALIALGGYLWWSTWSSPALVTAGGPASTISQTGDDTPVDVGPTPGIVVGTRPGKGIGGVEDSPPLIGLRGWRP